MKRYGQIKRAANLVRSILSASFVVRGERSTVRIYFVRAKSCAKHADAVQQSEHAKSY
jgi:hypothetical protein